MVAVVSGVVLDERVNEFIVDKTWNHVVLFVDDDFTVQDIVVGVVAMVNDKGKLNDQTGGVALAVGAGIGVVRRDAVVGQEFVLRHAIDDDATACAFGL